MPKQFTLTTDGGTKIEMYTGMRVNLMIDGVEYEVSVQEKN